MQSSRFTFILIFVHNSNKKLSLRILHINLPLFYISEVGIYIHINNRLFNSFYHCSLYVICFTYCYSTFLSYSSMFLLYNFVLNFSVNKLFSLIDETSNIITKYCLVFSLCQYDISVSV